LIVGNGDKSFTLRVVVADGVPNVHAWEDRVGGWAGLDGTSDLERVLPDNLGEMGPVTIGFLRAFLAIKVRKE
jgi:hypothetical protein